jgi:hypothetical protein
VNDISRLGFGAAILCGLLSVSAIGCGDSAAEPPTATAHSMKYDLYTHCGVDEARVNDTYYEALTPLTDGSGNPPRGWDNPVQAGVMTITSTTSAVFTDDRGHRVAFRIRENATTWKSLCS